MSTELPETLRSKSVRVQPVIAGPVKVGLAVRLKLSTPGWVGSQPAAARLLPAAYPV